MQKPDRERHARYQRVQQLCREMAQLVTLSLEQRRIIDALLSQLEAVTRGSIAGARHLSRTSAAGGLHGHGRQVPE